jgi:hypothetical protein
VYALGAMRDLAAFKSAAHPLCRTDIVDSSSPSQLALAAFIGFSSASGLLSPTCTGYRRNFLGKPYRLGRCTIL